jgi:radical SAM superfamily enzyme YgiQ (UPF0313 family)
MVSLSRAKGRLGRLTVSLNAFVPKPWTPFQWEPMAPVKVLKQRMDLIKKALAPLANLKVVSDVPTYAFLQGVLARGDRRAGGLIGDLAQGLSLKQAFARLHPEPDFYAARPRPRQEILPWSLMDHGLSMEYLWQEAQKAQNARQSPPCEPKTCRRCGVCG